MGSNAGETFTDVDLLRSGNEEKPTAEESRCRGCHNVSFARLRVFVTRLPKYSRESMKVL